MNDWSAINEALGKMARLQVRMDDATVVMNDSINKAKAKADAVIAPLDTQYEDLRLKIEAFCLTHKDQFARRRTKKLFFGSVGYRVSWKIVIGIGKDACLRTLDALGLTDYIRVTREPDKDALAALDDLTLAKVGASRVPDDRCTVKPDVEKIEQE